MSADGRATLKIFDVLGRDVATLVDGELQAGVVERVTFDASKFSSGLYMYRLEATNTAGRGRKFVETKKMMLLK